MPKQNFNDLVSSSTPTLVDFYAEWCGPCKMMGPILEDLKNSMGDDVRIVKIDVDKNPAAAAKFSVRGVPTLMVFKEGEMKWRQSGVLQVNQLEQIIKQYN